MYFIFSVIDKINSELDTLPTAEEVAKACKQMSSGKVLGQDAIPAKCTRQVALPC